MPAQDPADPIHDAYLALTQAGLNERIVHRELAAVRQRWQGACYIRSSDPSADSEIVQRLEQGQHPAQIAKAVGKHRTSIVRRRSRWLSERGPD